MTLTRNLYVLDEVVSALQTCLRNSWPRAAFWLWELIVSEECDIAFEVLMHAWLLYGGAVDPMIALVHRPAGEEEWMALIVRIQTAIRVADDKYAMFYLTETASRTYTLSAKATEPSPAAAAWSWSISGEDIAPEVARAWFTVMEAALAKGYRKDAAWLLQAAQPMLSADAIWSALRMLTAPYPPVQAITGELQRVASPHPVQQILYQMIPVSLMCYSPERLEPILMTGSPAVETALLHLRRTWAGWNANVGRRAARINAIPTEALHRETTRGCLSARFTNIDEIREPGPLLPLGCTFWQRVCRDAGAIPDPHTGGLVFPDDDTLEAFMDRWFPDDIPDEWSAADQQKSHGRGCATSAPQPPPTEPPIREESLDPEYLLLVLTGRS